MGEVKLSLCISTNDMKVHRGQWGKAPHILDLGIRCERSAWRPSHFTLWIKDLIPMDKMLGIPQSWSKHGCEEENLCPCHVMDPDQSACSQSLYTDLIIPAWELG
jgi:hypothetical protein